MENSERSGGATNVVVTDIRMPFMSMVVFIFKWALAAIPAIVLVVIVLFALIAALGTFVGLGGLFHRTASESTSVRLTPSPYSSSTSRIVDTSNNAIQTAIVRRQTDDAIALVEQGLIDINSQNSDGDTALHLAASNGDEAVVRALLRRRVNTKAVNKKGETAIDIANNRNDYSIVRLLK